MTPPARPPAIAGLAVAVAVAGLVALGPALHHRTVAQERRAAIERALREPVAPEGLMAPGEALLAPGRSAATDALDGTLRDIAAREGVLVEALGPIEAESALVAARHVVVSGEGHRILRFVEAVENRTPVIRFARYTMGATGKALRLDAEAMMPWEPAR